MSADHCQHIRLNFGSGDYYVVCDVCGAFWARMNGHRKEYGMDKDGNMIGADPNAANSKFRYDGLRIKP